MSARTDGLPWPCPGGLERRVLMVRRLVDALVLLFVAANAYHVLVAACRWFSAVTDGPPPVDILT
jgi:hypothetical protein